MVPTQDGEEVPLTLIHKKKLKKNRKNKLLLHGYGAYGIPLEIGFNIVYLSALEDDWILAFAHVRGGNEKGSQWHRAAKKLNKVNSFLDFINCAEYLIAEGFTNPALLCAYGSSAGGLLVGKRLT
jgi:prolyl oligopeptidase